MNREHKKIERLMLFSEVGRHLNFTLAAKELGISRGYLSDQVKRLEQELDVPLLIRTTRNVRLTEEGKRILDGMEDVRGSLIDLERGVVNNRQTLEGLIKITSPALFTERFLLDICHDFHTQHPAIRFSIDSSYINHDLTLSHFDLAFRATNTPPQNMVARALFEYRQCFCASPEYVARNGSPKCPSDLRHHQCLRGPNQAIWEFEDGEESTSGWLELNDNKMLKREAILGRGIIRVPEYLVDREIENGELVTLLDEETNAGQTIYAVHPQAIHQSKRLKSFIDFTQQRFTELADLSAEQRKLD